MQSAIPACNQVAMLPQRCNCASVRRNDDAMEYKCRLHKKILGEPNLFLARKDFAIPNTLAFVTFLSSKLEPYGHNLTVFKRGLLLYLLL